MMKVIGWSAGELTKFRPGLLLKLMQPSAGRIWQSSLLPGAEAEAGVGIAKNPVSHVGGEAGVRAGIEQRQVGRLCVVGWVKFRDVDVLPTGDQAGIHRVRAFVNEDGGPRVGTDLVSQGE